MSGSAATVSTATVRMMPRVAEEKISQNARPAAVPQSTRKSGQLVTLTHGAARVRRMSRRLPVPHFSDKPNMVVHPATSAPTIHKLPVAPRKNDAQNMTWYRAIQPRRRPCAAAAGAGRAGARPPA